MYKFTATIGKHNLPQKRYILAQLVQGFLADAQAINEYNLSLKLLQAWRKAPPLHS
jgi:hypothetical protein